jgi:DNA-binding MarR family transcriptional regulator
MSKPTLSGLLDGLEARGWVRRVEVAGDRRGVRLEATRDGRAAQRTAQRSMAARLDDVLHDATADDRAAVLCGLSTLRTTLSARWTAPR